MTPATQWTDHAAQQLVRYEALFALLDDIQTTDDVGAIARLVSARWKYMANVAAWRLVLPKGDDFLLIDGSGIGASLTTVPELPAWDREHWTSLRPSRVGPHDETSGPPPPDHLTARGIGEIEVLPLVRENQCVAVLSAGSRREPFGELDGRFLRLFGRYLADRLSSILLRQQATEELVHRATRDHLTDLMNRGSILEFLSRQLSLSSRTGQPVSVMIIDVDHFKAVNDTFGHSAGDSVLSEVSQRLHRAMRDNDGIGRYGGEEFLAVLYPCSAEEAALAAERLRRTVSDQPFAVRPDLQHPVTISLGTCTTRTASTGQAPPADASAAVDLLRLADAALYRSKARGRNCVTAAGFDRGAGS